MEKMFYYIFIGNEVKIFEELPEEISHLPRVEKIDDIFSIPKFFNIPNGWKIVGLWYVSERVSLMDSHGIFYHVYTEKDYEGVLKICKNYKNWDDYKEKTKDGENNHIRGLDPEKRIKILEDKLKEILAENERLKEGITSLYKNIERT